MNAQYLHPIKSLLFSKASVRVLFKNTETAYDGPIQGLRKFIAENPRAAVKRTEVNGVRGGVYVTFVPSNQEQRDFLSKKLNAPVVPGMCYTFGSREGARSFYLEMVKAGIQTTKRQWKYGAKEYAQAQARMPF